ncbi:FtsW/RodA/SpoVE family cell cycle protein [Paenibacillus filicis]|uniref:FtsW/RodA/SpoVE family cell cycle protein n=1 Tax=Paenibacillus filicis TaxID=669464 RepID=A0ABU9DLX1_9BACL
MQRSNPISQYIKTVCEQIRWKQAHPMVAEEFENHIIDQKNAYIAEGVDEETATVKAIHEMGDPVLIGTELDRTHRPNVEWGLIALTGCVLLLGIVIRLFMIRDANISGIWTNSILAALLGIGFMIIAYLLDFTSIGVHAKAIYGGLILVTIAVMMISPTINGEKLYVPFLLLLLPTVFAGIIYRLRSRGYLGIVLCGGCMVIPVIIGMAVPNFSSAGLYALTCLTLLTLAVAKGWFHVNKLMAMLLVYIPVVITAIMVLLTIVSRSYHWQRLHTAIDPSLDPMGGGYLGTITRDMIQGAAWLGQGERASYPGFPLPQVHTDSVLTYLIHKFGWASFMVIMLLVLSFMIRAFVLCSRQKSMLGRLVSTSVLITFTLQVALYIAYNLGLQIFSPLTLPLISYGGTATIINMFLIGIMLSVFKSGDVVRDRLIQRKRNRLIEFVDGKLIIHLYTKQ